MTTPLKRNSRDAPYHFAGRVEELVMLNDRLRLVAETGSTRGGLALVTGVPGAGKSTLVSEFVALSVTSSGVAAIDGGVPQLDNPTHLFLRMGGAIGAQEEFKEIADIHTQKKGGHLGAFSVRAGLDYEHVRTTIGLEGLLQASAEAGLWKNKTLIVSIDELQTVEKQQARTLKLLHEGIHHCPILPILIVGAGLQNTQAVLGGYGMSRVDDGVMLGPLERDATIEVISKSLEDFNRAAPPHVINELAEASHDFPQHIHGYITAALNAVQASVGWLDPDMLSKVIADGDKRRARYYNARLNAMGRGYSKMKPVIGCMVQGGVRALSMQAAIDAVDAAGFPGEQAVEDAIQHGVLTLEPEEHVSFGIPSFHNYMKCALAA